MISNLTRRTIICKKCLFKNNFSKIQGLIGKKDPEAIIFKTRFGIHTFLLKFPIDVAILDRNNKVVKLKRQLLPNRIFFWNIKFDTVIEFPNGSLEKSKTQTGDILEINL